MLYKPWDVILVPSAIVVSCGSYNESGDLLIGFLTSNLHGFSRLGDYTLQKWQEAGLSLPTRFRAKFATISGDIIIKSIGSLAILDRAAVSASIHDVLATV